MATHSSRNYPMDQKAPSSRVGMVDAENGESNKGEERPHTGVGPGVEAFDWSELPFSDSRPYVTGRSTSSGCSYKPFRALGLGNFSPFSPSSCFSVCVRAVCSYHTPLLSRRVPPSSVQCCRLSLGGFTLLSIAHHRLPPSPSPSLSAFPVASPLGKRIDGF
jgi:hypothetical protein